MGDSLTVLGISSMEWVSDNDDVDVDDCGRVDTEYVILGINRVEREIDDDNNIDKEGDDDDVENVQNSDVAG